MVRWCCRLLVMAWSILGWSLAGAQADGNKGKPQTFLFQPETSPGGILCGRSRPLDKTEALFCQAKRQWEESRAKKQDQPPEKEPHPELASVISILSQIVKEEPRHRVADSALYLLGFCYLDLQDDTNAAQIWQDLVRGYPSSIYLPETSLRLGELWFDEPDKLPQAIEAYGRALASNRSSVPVVAVTVCRSEAGQVVMVQG